MNHFAKLPDSWCRGRHVGRSVQRWTTLGAVLLVICVGCVSPIKRKFPTDKLSPDDVEMALFFEDMQVVKAVLADCPLIARMRLPDGQSLLHCAATNGSSKGVKQIVRTGCDVNLQDDDGETAVFCAVRFALNGYYLFGFDSEKEKAYRWIVHFLVDNGADINIANHDGQTPLKYVLDEHPNSSWVQFLRDLGATTVGHPRPKDKLLDDW